MKVGLLIPTYLSCLKYIQTALQKFFKEQTLEEQDFVQGDEKVSVANYIRSIDKDAKVVAFKRFSLSD